MNKKRAWLIMAGIALVIGILGVVFYGCGQVTGRDGTTTDYTISGKVGNITVSGLKASEALSVTHIVAIGSNNKKYLASPEADGDFTLGVKKGWPYAIGFYNKTDSTITLLGYLRQNQVSWESLPLMDPAGSSTDLGTVEIDTGSVEATPSVTLNELLTDVNMDNAVANLYGEVDDLMTVFTNLDVDGNGEFDFQEDKAYLLDMLVQIGKSNGLSSGEVDLALNQYYEDYYAIPHSYQFFFYAQEGAGGADKPAAGIQATLKFPQTIYDMNAGAKTSITGTTETSDYGWSVGIFTGGPSTSTYLTPEVVPSGTYTYEVTERGNYTFKNMKGAPLVAIGLTESIIYPVIKITTNEAGYLTTIDYKWKIRKDGVSREATAAEVKAIIGDTDLSDDSFVQTSPTIGVETNDDADHTYTKIERDASSLDVSSWNVKLSAISKLVVAYNLNNNIDCRYYFFK